MGTGRIEEESGEEVEMRGWTRQRREMSDDYAGPVGVGFSL